MAKIDYTFPIEKVHGKPLATLERMLDPEKLPGDQLGFKNQSKYKTFRGYVFAQIWAEMNG